MPLIQVKLIEGVFDSPEKAAIIEKLTDAMVSVEGEAMRPVTWVTIEEVPSGNGASVANRSTPATCWGCATPRPKDHRQQAIPLSARPNRIARAQSQPHPRARRVLILQRSSTTTHRDRSAPLSRRVATR